MKTEPTAFTPNGAVDLTNCDREPIHIISAVQSFGFLVAMTRDWIITRASENLSAFTGHGPEAVLGKPLEQLFTQNAIHAIRNRITLLRGDDAVERIFSVPLLEGREPFDVAMHFSGTALVIEAEPAHGEAVDAANQVRALMSRLTQTDSTNSFLREAVRQVRVLTGFDRVMIYRFDHSGSGEVAAEALRAGVDSFLGLNYPASDIPAQARALYVRNVFRIIADVDAVPVPITPTLDDAGQPLDQSLSVLRSVSPIHIEYLKNMGVKASLSISIVVEGKLWGLFACHHYEPLLPAFAQRSAAELYGQMFSLMLESRQRRDDADYEGRARVVVDRVMVAMGQDHELLTQAQWIGDAVMDIIPADGVGVFLDGAVSLAGLTPSREQFIAIVTALNGSAGGEIYTTDNIGTLVKGAESYASLAAGLLAIPYSRAPRDYVVLFRSERLRTVRWAGNPDKPVEYGPHGARLTPRKSFEEWSQMVKGKAQPFSASQLRVARTLRTALLEVLLRLSQDLDQERKRANEQQQLLIAELNHRVRNILSLIRGLLSQSRRDDLSTEDFIRTLDSRIQALARAHEQITARRYAPGRLRELIELEAGAYLGARRERVVITGPDLLITPNACTLLALVFHELMTNAAKYGALSDSGRVEVDWRLDDTGSLHVSWKETGGPAVTAPTRRGFGSTIIERSIPFELNGTAEMHYRVSGVEADFCIPKRYIAGLAASGTVTPPQDSKPAPAVEERMLAGKRVLLVEDSMLVALDTEDALRALGAAHVAVAPSLVAAAKVMDSPIDFAVLDFNLGAETSLPIVEQLVARGCPMVLATGYGEELELRADLRHIPVVSKPYDPAGLAAKIGEALRAGAR